MQMCYASFEEREREKIKEAGDKNGSFRLLVLVGIGIRLSFYDFVKYLNRLLVISIWIVSLGNFLHETLDYGFYSSMRFELSEILMPLPHRLRCQVDNQSNLLQLGKLESIPIKSGKSQRTIDRFHATTGDSVKVREIR